jgi:small-conductance mechanosensitive channel
MMQPLKRSRTETSAARRFGVLALLLILGLTAGRDLSAQEPGGPTVEADIPTAPVELDGSVLFRVRGASSFPAATRARQIRDRLVTIAADRAIPPESLRVVEGEGVSRITSGDLAIVTVVDADASLEQVQRSDLAGVHMERIRQAIIAYRAARAPDALRRSAVNALLATVLLVAVVAGSWWFWGSVDRFLVRRLNRRIQSVEAHSFALMRAERIWGLVRGGIFALRAVLLLAIALVYLGYVLAQFPPTRGLSRDMVTFSLGPLRLLGRGLVESIPSFVFLAVLFLVFRVILRLVRLFFDGVERGAIVLDRFEPDWAHPTYNVARVAIVAFGLIVAYPYIPGSQSAAFQGVTIFIGILFSLGSSSAISNIIAGYMMIYRRAFKVGDRIKIGDTIGDVIETRLQVTHLRSFKNEEIIIPNSQLLSSEVLNYSSLAKAQNGLILHTIVRIGYETPWRQVEAMLLLAAERTAGLLREPRPFVLQKGLGDFAVSYEINAFTTNVKAMAQLYTDLQRNILDVFNEYGVQIMVPAYEGDPPAPKVVTQDAWYAAPAANPAPEAGKAKSSR